jgi:hypothetical protein
LSLSSEKTVSNFAFSNWVNFVPLRRGATCRRVFSLWIRGGVWQWALEPGSVGLCTLIQVDP